MFNSRTHIVRIAAPIALVSALMLTGCGTGGSGTAAEAEPTGTGITSVENLQNQIDTWDDDLDASLEQFSLDLNAAAASGVAEVNVLAFNADEVIVNVLLSDEEGVLNGEQLTSVLGVLKKYEPTQPVGIYSIKSWTKDFYQGDAEKAALEIDLNSEFIDSDWRNVVIPGDRVSELPA